MTPTLDELIEQAHESLVRFTADEPWGMVTVRFHVELLKKYLQALQRLRELEATVKDSLTTAPTLRNSRMIAPRPGVPTVDEVGDREWCWVWSQYGAFWGLHLGESARYAAKRYFNVHWLPYDAIPMLEENQ